MLALEIVDCVKDYDKVEVLKNINLQVEKGKFITLLGPSGCGKSTLLRIIAGLETQTLGEVYIKGRNVSDIVPSNRNISMVFQSYALYPHLNVYNNIANPLKTRILSFWQKLPIIGKFIGNAKEKYDFIDKSVKESAKKLNIEQLLSRKPNELSGGQKQRVAIGRAMVRKPDLFLMDEPLSNLDAKLRVQMRTEIAALHRQLNETFIYVTHDQEEAMTMSDKVAVMMDGVILQFDTPHNIYTNPKHIKVAEFIGSPKINIFYTSVDENGFLVFKDKIINFKIYSNLKNIYLGVRPESFKITSEKTDQSINATIEHIENLGSHYILYILISDEDKASVVKVDDINNLKIGSQIQIELKPKKLLAFDIDSGKRLNGEKYEKQKNT